MARKRKPGTHHTLARVRGWFTRPRVIGLIAAILVLAAGAYGAGAAATVSGYRTRLASNTMQFSGSIQFEGQDFLSPMNTNMAFSGNYAKGSPPSLDGEFLGNWGGNEYSGQTRLAGGRLYLNLSGPVMPTIRYRQGSYLFPLESGRWYSEKADSSLYNNFCANNGPAPLASQLDLYRAVKTLSITPSPWVNFWSRLGDFGATHVSGSLSGAQLALLWDAVQKAAPPGCGGTNTLGLSSGDLKLVTTHVDLTSAHKGDQDHLVITLTDKVLGAKATITFDTLNYNQPVTINAPAGATDLDAVFNSFSAH